MEEKTQDQIDSEKILKKELQLKKREEIINRRVKDSKIERKTFYYNGNPKLKKAGVDLPFTKEQIEEYIKCKNDIIYFITTYCQIVSLDDGLIPFELYSYQEEVINTFNENRFTILTQSRQSGKTTTSAAYIVYELCFNKDKRTAILANKASTALEILDRVKKMFEELPWFLKPGVVEWNKSTIELGNGCKAIAAATSSSSIRGLSISILVLDEFAHIDNDVEFYTSTYPVISSGETTKVIILSTPNGLNLFYKIWQEAVEGRNKFIPKKFTWESHPNRDENWKKETMSNCGGPQAFAQEYECVSGDTEININSKNITIKELYDLL